MANRDCQAMRDALCVYADRERALREPPTALSLLISLSATRISAGSTPIIILALTRGKPLTVPFDFSIFFSESEQRSSNESKMLMI